MINVSKSSEKYEIQQDYEWNYENVPSANLGIPPSIVPLPGDWTYAGLPVASPLAVAAGPLLNSRWIEYYSKRGFDILTYKTVRRCARVSYDLPNLVPVDSKPINQPGKTIPATTQMTGSWAVSFGMPSREPSIWRQDVTKARQCLGQGQILSVSVVATPEVNDDLATISEDYATCAKWAFESGADVVELNFSCPNVSSRDGMLYSQPTASREILQRVRDVVCDRPLLVKLGYISDQDLAENWIGFAEGLVQGLVMINCIGAKVQASDGTELWDGSSRGIAGTAISGAVHSQVELFQSLIQERQSNLKTIAVGGISKSSEVSDYLQMGVESVQIATAAMRDPNWAVKVRTDLRS